jgi:outer membrane protein assembly factor BamB
VRYRIQLGMHYSVHVRAPQVVDGIGYAAMGDEKVYAFDARTGRVLYSHKVDQGSFHDNLVCGPYLLGNNHVVNVVERSTGRYIRNLLVDGEGATQMAVYGNRVFLGTHKGVYAFEC